MALAGCKLQNVLLDNSRSTKIGTNVHGSSSICKCRIFVIVFFRQAQMKKSKQTFEIQHVQIHVLPMT